MNHVLHYGSWWNPAVESQATDRAYRLGQPKQVHVYLPTGWLHITFDADLEPSGTELEMGEMPPWCLGLEVCTPWSRSFQKIALSDSKLRRPPDPEDFANQDVQLKKGVQIVGKVISWSGGQI
jgi:hypothetical protein